MRILMSQAEATNATARKPRFGLLALRCSLAVGCATAVTALFLGRPLDQAVSGGAAAALSGLFVWMTYRIVSHRDDGLIFVAMPASSVLLGDRYRGFLPSFLICVLSLAPIAYLFGAWSPRGRGKPAECGTTDPLHDEDLDRVI
jgi:hypothetical protein